MTINSIPFFLFFSIFLLIYYQLKSAKLQNYALAIGILLFYAYANIEMLPLLLAATVIYYAIGIGLERNIKYFNSWLIYGIGVVILGVFKYCNFFIDTFTGIFSLLVKDAIEASHINLILAVGISFYVFRLMSYALDVKSGKIKACHDFTRFFTYVSYFPSVMSGPIERFGHFDGQLNDSRNVDFNLMREGFQQVVWGMFKKIVIADTVAMTVAKAWNAPDETWAPMLFIAAALYSIQIYCDFSGYSDMAIGVSKIMGIKLKANFAYPYFSRNIQEFWRRWHISLTSWFTDYVYIPLGGSRCNKYRYYLNLLVVFVLSGLWHGQNMTFASWGGYNGLILIVLAALKCVKYKNDVERLSVKTFINIAFTFVLATFGWMMFRAPSMGMFWQYCSDMVSVSNWTMPSASILSYTVRIAVALLILLTLEWKYRKYEFPFQNKALHPAIMAVLFWLIISQRGGVTQFIYFNF